MSKHYKQQFYKNDNEIIYTLLIFATIYANAQTNPLRLNPNIVLPRTTLKAKLNNFA
jgi:hypothetical protein